MFRLIQMSFCLNLSYNVLIFAFNYLLTHQLIPPNHQNPPSLTLHFSSHSNYLQFLFYPDSQNLTSQKNSILSHYYFHHPIFQQIFIHFLRFILTYRLFYLSLNPLFRRFHHPRHHPQPIIQQYLKVTFHFYQIILIHLRKYPGNSSYFTLTTTIINHYIQFLITSFIMELDNHSTTSTLAVIIIILHFLFLSNHQFFIILIVVILDHHYYYFGSCHCRIQ